MLAVFLQTVLFQSLWLFGVMTLAAITPNLARFALAVGGLLVGVVLLINVTVTVMFRNLTNGPQLSDVTARSTQSAAAPLTLMTLLIMSAAALVVVQYRTRLKRFSIPTGLTGLVFAVLVMMWPWDTRPLAVPAWAANESSLQLVPDSPASEFTRWDLPPSSGPGTSWRFGSVRARLSSVEPGWLSTARLADSSIEFPDGTRVASAGNAYGVNVSSEPLETYVLHAALRRLLVVDRLSESPRFVTEAVPAMVVTEDQFRAHTGKAGTYHGRFLMDLDELQIASTLPLEPGVTFREPGLRLVIDHILTQGQSVSVRVRQFTTTTVFDSDAPPRLSFYLRNRKRAEAIAASTHYSTHRGPTETLATSVGVSAYSAGPGGGFQISSSYVRFDGHRSGDQSVELSDAWLAGAEFLIVRTLARGSVARTLVIPNFQMVEAPAKPFQ
jgi:hypothetical protein